MMPQVDTGRRYHPLDSGLLVPDAPEILRCAAGYVPGPVQRRRVLASGGGGAPAWSPTVDEPTNLQLCLDASDLTRQFTDVAGTTAVSANGQAVRRVVDSSSNSRVYTQPDSVSYAPLYSATGFGSGLACWEFDGLDDVLKATAGWCPTGALTIIVGVQHVVVPGTSSFDGILSLDDGTSSAFLIHCNFSGYQPRTVIGPISTSNVNGVGDGASLDTGAHAQAYTYDGSGASTVGAYGGRRDASTLTLAASSGLSAGAGTGNAIGAYRSAGTHPANVRVRRLAVWSRVLGSSALDSALAWSVAA